MEKGKLIKVTFEYENELAILEGEEICEPWITDINGALQLEQLRSGTNFKGLEKAEWKRFSKKEVRKMKLEKITDNNE